MATNAGDRVCDGVRALVCCLEPAAGMLNAMTAANFIVMVAPGRGARARLGKIWDGCSSYIDCVRPTACAGEHWVRSVGCNYVIDMKQAIYQLARIVKQITRRRRRGSSTETRRVLRFGKSAGWKAEAKLPLDWATLDSPQGLVQGKRKAVNRCCRCLSDSTGA